MKKNKKIILYLFIVNTLFLLSACSPTESITPTPEATNDIPRITQTIISAPSLEFTATPDFALTATEQVNSMRNVMQKLADEDLIRNPEGDYYRVQDFTGEWAKLGYYHWWPLDHSSANFAIRADVNWEIASTSANYGRAGCGFVYHENGPEDLHFTFLSMDGYVKTVRMEKNIFTEMKANFADKFEYPADSASVMLVVDNQWITFFVNEIEIIRFQDDRLNGGNLSLAVASGTNNGYGTRCNFSNVELWEFN